MDIAALSMDLSSIKIDQQVKTGVLKMAIDLPKMGMDLLLDEMQSLQKEMESILMPYLGQNIDVYA